ncbi:diguanylate cyclase domain-containing protein, partial [Massilia sp. CT11-108]|uniref:diguanylate cyclase domain-containing protein n=1 Tax=Massilia sp. CT11-108 TaxID=3393900 RepID=UPI0039A43011
FFKPPPAPPPPGGPRLAGDEFVIVLEQVGSPLECERIGAKLLDAIRAPFLLDGHTLAVTSSIGIAWSARPEQVALAHAADDGLYRSKHAGRDTVSVLVVEETTAAGSGSRHPSR